MGTPALAFVRAVCEVLGLDSAVEAEVAVLRRNLLRLAHTREFAPAAAFKARTCLVHCRHVHLLRHGQAHTP